MQTDSFSSAVAPERRSTAHAAPDVWRGNKSVMLFGLIIGDTETTRRTENFPWHLEGLVNRTAWMGKEPSSCMVLASVPNCRFHWRSRDQAQPYDFIVAVGYRPEGWTSHVQDGGRRRLNGWTLQVRCELEDGTLADAEGNPLAEDCEPVFRSYGVFRTAEFQDHDFGDFLQEV